MNNSNEIIFLVEEAPEGGYTARALGESIFTEADDLANLHQQVRDAVHCHFDEGKVPEMIQLHFVRVRHEIAAECSRNRVDQSPLALLARLAATSG